nr:uncharacterized protein LOC116808104 [Taeniopygia guttata]
MNPNHLLILLCLIIPSYTWIIPQPTKNLTSKAGDVRKAINQMRDMIKDIKTETGDGLSDLVGNWGISGWATSILHSGLVIVFILILALVVFRILRRLVSNLITKALTVHATNPAVLLSAQGPEVDEEDQPVPEPEGPWVETAPTCQPWFADTYPDSEFLPRPKFNSF